MAVTVSSRAPISVDGTHLAEWDVEGSIPSPQCRHHVVRHRMTGAADRYSWLWRRTRPLALTNDRRLPNACTPTRVEHLLSGDELRPVVRGDGHRATAPRAI